MISGFVCNSRPGGLDFGVTGRVANDIGWYYAVANRLRLFYFGHLAGIAVNPRKEKHHDKIIRKSYPHH